MSTSLTRKLTTLAGMTALAMPSMRAQADVVAYWNFNEGAGNTAYDSTGNGNNGTLENGVSWTTDSVSGHALRFDGINDRIMVDNTQSMRLTDNLTIDAFVKRDSNQDGTIFSCNGPFFMAVRNNKLYGGVYNTENTTDGWVDVQGTTDLQLNRWYKLSITYDGSSVNAFVNGTLDGFTPATGTRNPDRFAYRPWIGWGEYGQDQYFHGTIDELKIHDVAIPSPSSPSLALTGIGLLTMTRKRGM